MHFQEIEKKIMYLIHDDNKYCEFDRFTNVLKIISSKIRQSD